MSNGHSDASTSTEDMKGRPLCLYYFTHPFGVLSPEPPRVAATFEAASNGGSVISVAGARYTFDIGTLNLPTFPMWPGAGARLPPLRVMRPPQPNIIRNVGKRSLPPLAAAPTPPSVAPPRLRMPRPRSLALRKIGRRLRYVKGGRGSAEGESRALRAALRRLRDAWPPPRSSNCDSDQESEGRSSAMWRRAGPESPALTPRPGASPGLLRRRYSVPETVMRKYRLAQLNSEEASRSSVEACCCTPEPAPRLLRRDRELMRRSALLRRLHGRSCRACCCGGCDCTRATRSLDASHSELRPSSRRSPASGRTSPKRLRLDSPTPRESRVILTPPSSELALSVSSRAQTLGVSYTDTDVFVASSTSESDYRDATDMSSSTFQCSGTTDVRTSTPAIEIDNVTSSSEDKSFADSSDTCSASMCTAKETVANTDQNLDKFINRKEAEDIINKFDNRTTSAETDSDRVMPYDRPLTVETPSYDILEIVVSETLNTIHAPIANIDLPEKNKMLKSSHERIKKINDSRSANIDEYVSNILVESLNSLTDQLESMNASMGGNGKLSIIEKEIKVKLQNTGVNTIVHLSPTSNNQIIFGHEELCCSDERPDSYNNARNNSVSPVIRDVIQSPETNINQTSAESLLPSVSPDHRQAESFSNVIQSDNVNKAVLQQIQKLFQDDIQKMEPDKRYLKDSMPSIAHIEISNVDVYIDNNIRSYSATTDGTQKDAQICPDSSELISSVGTGNYYENERDNAIVPRFSAFPHTDSMEVNTSSSDDAEMIGSECTSLVDSLDDPNSPRSIMIRKSAKRSELVRSSIDVLDLLPENVHQTECASFKDKGEAFFVRIKDDDCECDCEKEDIVVADHMPETIKQRLLRRHRNRELRMESARRSKVKQLRKELEKQRQSEMRISKRELERECIALINALVDDVITKIAQDEYKCMRIKQKSVMMVSAKSDESLSRKNWKKDAELNNKQILKNNTARSCSDGINKTHRKAEKYQIRGKLSLQTYPPLTSDDTNTKRIYQKSEIHDGKKCIEILEILEYVNGSESSPETDNQRTDSDDNQSAKHKKSRIPVPVPEKSSSQNSVRSSNSSRTQLFHNRNEKMSVYSPCSSHVTYSEQSLANTDSPPFNTSPNQTPRRASIPHCESRARSNSLRFKRVFDMIPEERSSISVDSPNTEQTQIRRASVPSLTDGLLSFNSETDLKMSLIAADNVEQKQYLKPNSTDKKTKVMRSAGTSPMPNSDAYHSVLTQTRGIASPPLQRSAATSPIRNLTMSTQTPMPRRKSISNQQHPSQQQQQTQKQQQKSRTPPRLQHELPRPPQQQPRITRHRVAPEPAPRQRLEGGGNRSFFRRRSVSSQREAEKLPRCGKGHMEMAESGVAGGASASSSSSESGGSLLCPLAPAWLQARRRRRRANAAGSGQWAVTVAGSCPAALPADVEMRLRFPEAQQPRISARPGHAQTPQRGLTVSPPSTRRAVRCSAQTPEEPRRLTLTMKKEASDSSILASKSVKKSMDPLPDVETFRASRSKTKSSVKTRRGYSLHCWLPDGGHTPIRASNGLSVLGSAIVPEQKPRRPLPAYYRY